jgi:hypothetical protein
VNYASSSSHCGTYHYDKGERRVGAGPPGRENFLTFFAKTLDK